MEKKSGVQSTGRSLPGTGGSQNMGDQFQANLAMGGGSYKIPFDLPQGPGGFAPKIELNYNTGTGNGVFGLGWAMAQPFIQRKPGSPYTAETAASEHFSLAGADTLIPLDDAGAYIPTVQQILQPFRYQDGYWTSVTTELVQMQLGSTPNSRIGQTIDGKEIVAGWLLDKLTFPGDRTITFRYEESGAQRLLKTVTWSVFTLELEYEDRPDPFSVYTAGLEIRTDKRCKKLSIHQSRLAPDTLMRSYDLAYTETSYNKLSLLSSYAITGWRSVDGVLTPSPQPAFTFGYTQWDVSSKQIRKFRSLVSPPPFMREDSTVLDYKGTALPGILRLNGLEATYWENRGDLQWGPPQKLNALPQGIQLSDENVRFADLTGNGTSDLVLADTGGGGYYPNDPEQGFLRKTSLPLAPGFNLDAANTWLIDLDGDRVTDLLTFRNNAPMAFFNKNGQEWEGPVVLPQGPLNGLTARFPYVRFADMTGNGNPDLVRMVSRRIVYYPFLGDGKWGAAKPMTNSPEFDLLNPTTGIFLTDVDGDGISDLVITSGQTVRIYINSNGNFYSDPIVIDRTPRFDPERFLLSDMTGSGVAGFLWTAESSASNPHEYWYLDLLNGVKPNLLNSIDNGRGLHIDITYSTSAFERSRDLAKGYRWAGYLPFVVHVVKQIVTKDTVTNDTQTTRYDYHEGHFDGNAREYMGFGMVESRKAPTPNEAEVWQKNYYHNRHQTAFDPAFIAGKGQPHRMETLDPTTAVVCQSDESQWEARPIPTADPNAKAWLTLERGRSSKRYDGGHIYAEENYTFDVDAIGNRKKEDRTGKWKDAANIEHIDTLNIVYAYASHDIYGLTSFQSQVIKTDAAGKMLKHCSFFFDGEPFTGLGLGKVDKGFRSRQTEIALTESQHIATAYGGLDTAVLPYYRVETDPVFGKVYVHDTRRYRNDALGNQLETIDAIGHHVKYTFDPENIHPTSYQNDDLSPKTLQFDLIAQQLAVTEDLNGNRTITEYDGFGNITKVYQRDAEAGKPTESYEYSHAIPNSTTQRIRTNAADAEPGYVKITYFDGNGRTAQEKILTETGQYTVSKQDKQTVLGRKTGTSDAWLSNNPDFEAEPTTLAKQSLYYDFGARIIREELFNGTAIEYAYHDNETWFFSAKDVALRADDPGHIPSRTSRQNAWGKTVSLVERDGAGVYEEKRDYDGLGQLTRVVDPLGHTSLLNIYDGWGSIIYTKSAEAGEIRKVFNAANQMTLRTDADNRTIAYNYDKQGRITEIRDDGPAGPLHEQFQYDTPGAGNPIGRLTRVTGPFWHVEYAYNADGKATLIRWHFDDLPNPLEVAFSYDQQQKMTSLTYPDGTTIRYDYFPSGLLRSIPGFIDAIEYGVTGKRTKVKFANQLETIRTYTSGDYLLSELLTQNADHSVKFQHQRYTLDEIGQILKLDDLANVTGKARNNQTFTYDLRNRLTRSTGHGAAGDYDFEYRYDELGNIIFSGESFGEDMDYGHHAGDTEHPNRLIKRKSSPAPEYQYDASGNLTVDPETGTITFDKRQRVIRIDKTNGDILEYAYDHNDQRIRTTLTPADGGPTRVRYEVEGIWMQDQANTTKIVMDEGQKLAIIPGSGDTLLHHLDRLGNVNILTNLATGAYVGQDEYTPYGQRTLSLVIEPAFTFKGLEFSDGLDMVMLGARMYRPRLGRFISPDLYLIDKQDKIPGILSAINMYCFVYDNPTNGADPTGNFAFLVILIVAIIVGAVAGAIGAAVNGVKAWDEWLLWILGGAIGGALVAITGGGAIGWLAMLFGASFTTAATIGVAVFAVAALIGSWATKLLDKTDSPFAWVVSWLFKWAQSPVLTTIGLIVAGFMALGGKSVDFRRGMLFVETGAGNGALTLGSIAWTQSSRFTDGKVSDDLALHESTHSRTVASIGELGFYFTYLTAGVIFGIAEGGSWNDLNDKGCGNPFEKKAHTFTEPATPSC